MSSNKDSIIVLIPLVWSYRNFIINGVCAELEKKHNVYYAIPEVAKTSFEELGIQNSRLIISKSKNRNTLQVHLFRILKRAFAKRFPVNTTAILKKLDPNQTHSLNQKILYQLPALFFSVTPFYSLLKFVETKLYTANLKETQELLEKLNPLFILSTTNVVDTEWELFRVAQTLNIKTFTHILSFDNLTSRGYLPIEKFDTYFVWNQSMKMELIKYYNIKPSNIIISGTPQFDYHTDPIYALSRNETLKKVGLSEEDHYILYCANHYALSPNEPELLNNILTEFNQNRELSSYKIILRFHPMDNYDRWDNLLQKHPSIVVSMPWEHKDSKSVFWGNPTVDDLIFFSNILRYCNVMLNIASTVSIDAAITNTPTVCVGFHPTIKTEGNFYYELHYSEHYAPIMKSGATPLAKSSKELITLICEQIKNRRRLENERRSLKNRFSPNLPRLSSSIILEVLMNDKNN